MAPLVSDDGREGEVLRVGVALERLGKDRQQVFFGRTALAVLSAARPAVNMAVLDASDEAEPSCETCDTVAAGLSFGRGSETAESASP
jgi:hypothetical protein